MHNLTISFQWVLTLHSFSDVMPWFILAVTLQHLKGLRAETKIGNIDLDLFRILGGNTNFYLSSFPHLDVSSVK